MEHSIYIIESNDETFENLLQLSFIMITAAECYKNDKIVFEIYMNKNIELLSRLNKMLANKKVNMSAYFGYIGLADITNNVHTHTGYLNKFNTQLKNFILDYFLDFIDEIKYIKEINHRYYDIFYGICSFLGYFLRFSFDDRIISALKIGLNYLIEITLSGDDIFQSKYCMTRDNIISENIKKTVSFKYIDMGIAHGIAAPMTILSMALKYGIEIPEQKNAIYRLHKFYSDNIHTRQGRLQIPKYVSINEDSATQLVYNNRISWCYGELGVSRALYLTGQTTDNNINETAFNVIEGISLMNKSTLGLTSPCFCHGFSGLSYIMNLFYRDMNEKKDKLKFFCEEINEVAIELLINDMNLRNLSVVDGLASVICSLMIQKYNITNSLFSKIMLLEF